MKIVAWINGVINLVFIPAWAAESRCHPRKRIVFSCSLGNKRVLVCAYSDFSANRRHLHQFEQQSTLEPLFPVLTESALTPQFIWARNLMFTGGAGDYLRIVPLHMYTAIGKDWGARNGVAVEKNNQFIVNLECRDIPITKLSEAFFTRAGLPIDQNAFLIPDLD